MLAGNVEDWTGNADGSFSLAAGFDAERIYVAAKIMDEKIIDGDSFSVIIDPRPLLSRLATNRLGRESIAVTVQAPPSEEVTACSVAAPGRRESRSSQYQAFGRRVKQGYELEISMPIANLVEAQGADWANFQVGARMGDVDTQEDKSLEVLWRASPDRTANRGFAHVIRK